MIENEVGKVSICIPTFNSERFLSATIQSVTQQTYQNLQIVISDGGSTDRTMNIIDQMRDRRFKVLRSATRLSPGENWSRSIQMADGEFVMLLCHDDLLVPSAISRLVEVHTANPSLIAAAGNRNLIREDGSPLKLQRRQLEPLKKWNHEKLVEEILRTGTNPIGEGLCVLWKAEAGIWSFSTDWNYYIDLEFWIRLTKIGAIIQTEDVVGHFRVTRTSWTSTIGVGVVREIWRFFKFLGETESAPKMQRMKGCMLATTKGIARPILQQVVNRGPRGSWDNRQQT